MKVHLMPIGWQLDKLEYMEKRQAGQAAQKVMERTREAAARESDIIFLMNFMGYPRGEAEKIATEIAKLPLNIREVVRIAEGPIDFETFWAKTTYDYTVNIETDDYD